MDIVDAITAPDTIRKINAYSHPIHIEVPTQPTIPPMPQKIITSKCKFLLPCGMCEKFDRRCDHEGV